MWLLNRYCFSSGFFHILVGNLVNHTISDEYKFWPAALEFKKWLLSVVATVAPFILIGSFSFSVVTKTVIFDHRRRIFSAFGRLGKNPIDL